MKRFGITTNTEKDIDMTTTLMIKEYLLNKGMTCLLDGDYADTPETFAAGIDCLLVLGGDGTFIQSARKFGKYNIPMLGINMGTLGFLTSVEKEDVEECLDGLISDKFSIETRMMISGSVYKDGKESMIADAVNDIVVSRSGFSRLVELKLYINNNLVDIYVADGVIVSTPTGSTGYNLSAGGPVVYPETELMVITPICPHSLTARSIVVSGKESIRIEIGRRSKTQQEEALVTYDGQQTIVELGTGDQVEIGRSNHCIQLIKMNNRSFYQVLREKIGNV